MRIALDATYSIGRNLSGVGVYSREILSGLAEAHPEAEFLFCYRPHRFLRSFKEALPANARRRLLAERLAPRGVDLFHGLNQRLPRARARRSVATFHDLFVITGEYSTPEFRRRFEAQARDAAARADLIVAVSAFTARQVEQCLGVEPSRVRVVHHGVRPPAAEPRDRAAREPVVLHVGAIQKRKNVERLVRAFEQMDAAWRLVLAGSAGYGAGAILEAIQRSPARARIELTGYLSREQLEHWYERAAVFAFPSLDEGFGMPVLEAMSHGVPVLTSNGSALAEVAGDAALLVDPQETAQIAEGLCRLARDPDLRRDLAQRGRLRAGLFTWQETTLKTWRVYSELGPRV